MKFSLETLHSKYPRSGGQGTQIWCSTFKPKMRLKPQALTRITHI